MRVLSRLAMSNAEATPSGAPRITQYNVLPMTIGKSRSVVKKRI